MTMVSMKTTILRTISFLWKSLNLYWSFQDTLISDLQENLILRSGQGSILLETSSWTFGWLSTTLVVLCLLWFHKLVWTFLLLLPRLSKSFPTPRVHELLNLVNDVIGSGLRCLYHFRADPERVSAKPLHIVEPVAP